MINAQSYVLTYLSLDWGGEETTGENWKAYLGTFTLQVLLKKHARLCNQYINYWWPDANMGR